MRECIIVNRIAEDAWDVILPENGAIWLTVFRRFYSLQEFADYLRAKGLQFKRIHAVYELTNSALAQAVQGQV